MTSKPLSIAILPLAFALTAATSFLARSETIPEVSPEIVSAWQLNGENAIAVFTHDGRFYTIIDSPDTVGFERGTFTWDKESNAFSAAIIVDTNGDEGFSDSEGATYISISGDTLSYASMGQSTLTFTRIVNTDSPIVGSWYIPGERVTATFLSDGSYFFAQEANDAPSGYDGIERGSYTWDESSKVLATNPLRDTNGDIGLGNLPLDFTATIIGNSMVFYDGSESIMLRRITPVAAPLNTEDDFEVDKFANYRQTSNASPTLLTGSPTNLTDEFPFWGEAYIEPTVLGTAGTLSITGRPSIDFVEDDNGEPVGDDFHEWDIERQYTSPASLNAAFPDDANYVFTRGDGSATLNFPAGGTFLATPKVQLGEGAWNGNKYHLGTNQTLIWSPISGYDPATMVTVISVVYETETEYEEIFKEAVIQGDVTSYDLSGKLQPGRSYSVQLEHVKIASSTTSGTGPFSGKLGYALYNSNTRFEMVAPSTPDEPAISEQPASQQGTPGSPLVLSVGINEEAFQFATFQWFRNDVALKGQTGNSLYFPSYDVNSHSGNYYVSVTNPAGSADSGIANITNPPASSYTTWQSGFFNPTQLANPAISGDDVDFDNDGVPNLLEYLFGGNPTLPSSGVLPAITKAPGSSNVVFTYKRKVSATGVTQVIEHATSLTPPWTPAVHGQNGVTITTALVPGDTSTEQVTVTIPSTGISRFVRLRAAR